MSFALIDFGDDWNRLLPLTYTRPISELRIGILTIREKWEKLLDRSSMGNYTVDYLSQKYPVPSDKPDLIINSTICPDEKLVELLLELDDDTCLVSDEVIIGMNLKNASLEALDSLKRVPTSIHISKINYCWDIFAINGDEIQKDFQLITAGRTSNSINDDHTILYGDQLFVEEGVTVKAAIINSEEGPVYLGKNAKIHEGAVVKGPFVLCEGSEINMGSKMRGRTTIGPFSKVGGEISNSVIIGNSNKGHDGFLGSSVIGEWCNLGADTNNSNLKNNYSDVKVWNYHLEEFVNSGLQFCGIFMGDHSKCGINTMFNTGTIIGVSVNLFSGGFHSRFVPSFSWGDSTLTTYKMNKALETAEHVMKRRNIDLSVMDKKILSNVFESSAKYRDFD